MQFAFPFPCTVNNVISTGSLNVTLTVVVLADTLVAPFAGTVDITENPADVPCVFCAQARLAANKQRKATVTLFMGTSSKM
jgi:hypothetical protein